MEPFIVRQSWWPMLKGILGGSVFMLGGIWYLKSNIDEHSGFELTRDNIIVSLCTLMGLALTIFYGIKSLSKNKVLVELNKEGLHQGKESIAWEDIDAFKIREFGSGNAQKMIVFFLKEAAKGKYPKSKFNQLGSTLTNADFDGGVNFELSGLPIEEMMATLEKYKSYYTPANRETS